MASAIVARVSLQPLLQLLEWTHRALTGRGQKDGERATERLGRAGEDAAYFYLRRRGYLVVARRWIVPHLDGEVDLIGWDKGTLCFIEVKTRSRRDRFAAEFAVDERKMDALRRMSAAYVRRLPWRGKPMESLPVRFDVVSVYLTEEGGTPSVELVQNAFA